MSGVGRGQHTASRELPWDQDIHPGSPELSEQHHTATLDDRYGRTPGRARRSRFIAITAAIAVVVVFAAWVIWAGLDQSDRGLSTDDVGYQVLSAHSTVVHSQVSVDPGNRAKCAVQVLDKSYSIVGWKEITLAASEQRTRSVSTEVTTTTRGVTGLIHDCWVP
ncbi:DUF4307 domain-containing protein [Curtobacterium sp. PhB115]|uniref:DUF4307 domain-containing protein n=1 Tax=Curtobacterium sp. PhB115 TaxID=2485173 RepID=UPI000F971BAC|nr:DUF4307 domain-containing protein [Curtobacterium sp. PhB115]ROP74455.1 uncharacterized protein DUF4307 [Curtobacterium sp. PhB115]